ncbi:MAG: ArsR family transcriptional regulator [Clostridiales bacterium]|nr:MAG: ArsR family transcriptional regulator [Clostridiales bacterium]
MAEVSGAEFFKCFGDKTRFEIVKLLLDGNSYVEIIASKLSLTPATVCFHLKKLEACGLVTTERQQFYIIYKLNKELLQKPLISWFEASDVLQDDKYEKGVLLAFFKYGKLISIPVQLKKREIVLREILKDFEQGREYSEKEVNEIILKYHSDYCYIRREMIGLKMLSRNDGIYKKIIKS